MSIRIRTTLSNVLELSRPWGWFTSIFLLIGIYFSTFKTAVNWSNVIISVIGIICVVAGCFALNDWFDRHKDLQIHPNRILPTSRQAPTFVFLLSITELTIGVILLSIIGRTYFFLGLTAVFLSVIYSPAKQYNSILGNVITATMSSLVVIYAGFLANNLVFRDKIMVLSIITFLIIFSRELLKDIEDMKMEYGFRRTLPMIIGVPTTYKISAAIFTLGTVLCLLYVALLNNIFISALLLPLVVFGFIVANRMRRASAQDATFFVLQIKRAMIYFVVVLSLTSLL